VGMLTRGSGPVKKTYGQSSSRNRLAQDFSHRDMPNRNPQELVGIHIPVNASDVGTCLTKAKAESYHAHSRL
jgi:hypothetical protein